MYSDFRFAIAALLLAGSALIVHSREKAEMLPPRRPLAGFPRQVGRFSGSDLPISDDLLKTLGNGEFVARRYRDQMGHSSPIDLFIAYFASQRTGETLHSPLNCLPGSGWSLVKAERIPLSATGRESFLSNRDLVAKGSDRALVLYWYWSHGRGVASEYAAKWYLVADSIRLHRSDGALIRISTPLGPRETTDDAETQLTEFADGLLSSIDAYVPR